MTALGWGTRAGIWLQGCTLGCPGCLSRDTWPASEDAGVDLVEIERWLERVMPLSDGLTISGGEPFEQAEALEAIAVAARDAAGDRAIDILVYSGRRWDDLDRDHRDVLVELDAVISEPFDAHLPADDGWRGSTNQRFHALTELGASRTPATWAAERRLQIMVDDTQVWMVGIPRHGDLVRLEAQLAEDGIRLGNVTWRP